MKKIILGLAVALSTSAIAHEVPAFLKQFQNKKFEIVDTLFSNYGEGEGFVPNVGVKAKLSNGVTRTHYVSIMNACVDGDNVQTIAPIKSCLSYEFPIKDCEEDKRRRLAGEPPRRTKHVCYDETKPKVCEGYEVVTASAPIETTKSKCAKKGSAEHREWKKALKKKYWNNKEKYKKELAKYRDDFPKCTIFDSYQSFLRTEYNFDIVKNIKKYDRDGELNDNWDRTVKGELLMNVDVELPQCM